jgi:hypothetical protein
MLTKDWVAKVSFDLKSEDRILEGRPQRSQTQGWAGVFAPLGVGRECASGEQRGGHHAGCEQVRRSSFLCYGLNVSWISWGHIRKAWRNLSGKVMAASNGGVGKLASEFGHSAD